MLRVKFKKLLVVTLASTNCTRRVRGRNGYRPRSSVNNVHSQAITEVFWNSYRKLSWMRAKYYYFWSFFLSHISWKPDDPAPHLPNKVAHLIAELEVLACRSMPGPVFFVWQCKYSHPKHYFYKQEDFTSYELHSISVSQCIIRSFYLSKYLITQIYK